MKFKRSLALAASLALMSFSALSVPTVFADDSDEIAIQETTEAAENFTSKDGVWTYSIPKNGGDSASIESYTGHDSEITIPDEIDGHKVGKLGEYAFYENTLVTKFIIPEGIKELGEFSFFGCESLKEFDVSDENSTFDDKDGCLVTDDGKLFVCYPPAKEGTSYEVPEGTQELSSAAFAVCRSLTDVALPASLRTIGLYCFAECGSLNNVVIPENVQSLDMFAFTGCTSLTDITLPRKMNEIGAGAFFKCTSLDKIEFPSQLYTIGQGAFISTAFKEIVIPPTVQEIGYSAFGFTADEQGNIIPMESFTVKGITGSMAQRYCADEGNDHISFVPIDDTYEPPTENIFDIDLSEAVVAPSVGRASTGDEIIGLPKPVFIAVCVLFVSAMALVVLITLSVRKPETENGKQDQK